jgi:nucleoside-diphosphate-sugar epimerase
LNPETSSVLGEFEFCIRGSRGRLGKQISQWLQFYFPETPVRSVMAYGGSFEYIGNFKTADKKILFIASGRSNAKTTAGECDYELNEFAKMLEEMGDGLLSKGNNVLVFISSGGTVYERGANAQFENSNLRPNSPYAYLKLAEEQLLKEFATRMGIKLLIFRISNAYLGEPGIQKGIVDSLLSIKPGMPLLEISVSPESQKQYGTFQDYAYNILEMLADFIVSGQNYRLQNLFSSHIYSVHQIVEIVSSHMEIQISEICYRSNQVEALENDTVILDSIFNVRTRDLKWEALETVLSRSRP